METGKVNVRVTDTGVTRWESNEVEMSVSDAVRGQFPRQAEIKRKKQQLQGDSYLTTGGK